MTSPPHDRDRVLTCDIYTPASIAQAIEDYRPHLRVRVLRQDATATLISFAAPTGEEAPEQVVREFLNYKLHIFVTTLRCEHSCHYCQVSRQSADRVKYDMSEETALRALDLMFRSPASHLTLEFQGGEPLLNFDLIRFIVPRAKERAAVLS